MDAGQLNKRITFQAKGQTQDAYGAPNRTTYTDMITVWCGVVAINEQERFMASQDAPLQTKRFRIRYRTGLDEDLVILYGDYRYNIKGIDETGDQSRQYLDITATRYERAFEPFLTSDGETFQTSDEEDLHVSISGS